MNNARRRSPRWQGSLALIIAGAAACSLQDFGYLQDKGSAGASQGGAPQGGGEPGGQSGGPVTGGTGGSSPSGGSSGIGGAEEAGSGGVGTGGAEPARAGEGGGGGAAPDAVEGGRGGAGGEAGTSLGAAGLGGADPGGGTNSLVNGSFENNYTGWKFEPPSARGTLAYVQWPRTGATNVDGAFQLSTWSETTAFTVEISQVVTGLAAGRYTFKAWFNRGDGLNAAYVFARGCGGEDDYQEDIPLTGAVQWIEVGIGGIEVVGSRCEVGFFVDSNANDWLNADAFSFEQDPQ